MKLSVLRELIDNAIAVIGDMECVTTDGYGNYDRIINTPKVERVVQVTPDEFVETKDDEDSKAQEVVLIW